MLPTIFVSGPDPTCFLDLHPHRLEIEPHLLQNIHGHALAELDQTEQEMFGADVIVIETIGFFSRKLQDLLSARGEVIHFFPARNYPLPLAPAPLY
jgi:hypothetical protein